MHPPFPAVEAVLIACLVGPIFAADLYLARRGLGHISLGNAEECLTLLQFDKVLALKGARVRVAGNYTVYGTIICSELRLTGDSGPLTHIKRRARSILKFPSHRDLSGLGHGGRLRGYGE